MANATLDKAVSNGRTDPAFAITLIHGTYAANAEWVEAGSAMRVALEATQGEPCLFGSFGWSGDNNLFARILAAQELIEHLQKIQAAHPDIRHILIAHSHGGNIALQAAHHGKNLGTVSGICCLATPFFHVRLRDEREVSAKMLQSVVLAMFSVPYLCISLFHPIFRLWSFIFWVAAYLLSAALGGFLSGGVALRPAAANIVEWSHARCATNLHVLRASGDEASLVLSVGQLSAWAARKAIARFARAEEANPMYVAVRRAPLPSALWRTAIVIGVAALVCTGLAASELVSASWAKPLISLEAALGVIVLAIKTRWLDRYLFGFAALGLLMSMLLNRKLVGTSISRALRDEGGLGPWPVPTIAAALLALMIDFKAESTPEGDWPIEILPPRSDAPADLMVHSLYEHPVAITRVADWLQDIRSERIAAAQT